MSINGSDLINEPIDTIFSPFTDLLGSSFWLIPLSFITVALYMKTRDVVVTSLFMIGSGVFLAGGSIFAGYPEMILVYGGFATVGLIGIILDIYFMKR